MDALRQEFMEDINIFTLSTYSGGLGPSLPYRSLCPNLPIQFFPKSSHASSR